MKIKRTTKLSIKFTNQRKKDTLRDVIHEYSRIVNYFIELFWLNTPSKAALLKQIVNLPQTWLSHRCRKVAAREAIDMIVTSKSCALALKREPTKPTHRGKRVCWSSSLVRLDIAKNSSEFDGWLHISSVGNGIIIDLPVKLHKHFCQLAAVGKRNESYIVSSDYVQLCFEIDTGPKKTEGDLVGVDSGVNTLAATSYGKLYGQEIKEIITVINRCKHGSKRQKRLRRCLRHRMDEVAKQVVTNNTRLIVVEKLKGISNKTKKNRRASKKIRKVLGAWNYRYWLRRLEMVCEARRSSFRSVPPMYTSQRCPACDHTEQRNRNGEAFLCRSCGYADNADVVGAKNVLFRFLTGPYCAGFKSSIMKERF